jgi:hypothetical protein
MGAAHCECSAKGMSRKLVVYDGREKGGKIKLIDALSLTLGWMLVAGCPSAG